jgi:hypothetical protein
VTTVPQPPTGTMLQESLIDWNVGNKSDKLLLAALLDMVEKFSPAGFALQEVADRGVLLTKFCELTGYVLTRLTKGPHSKSVAVLTRSDIPINGEPDAFQMTERTWVGQKVAGSKDDGMTAPKWTVYVPVTFWNLDWEIASTHLTPSHQVALVRSLVVKQVAQIALWMSTRRKKIVALGGDFNETLDSRFGLLAPLKLFAVPFTGPSHKDSRAIDIWWLLRRKLRRYNITVVVDILEEYDESDHKPNMITLSMPKPAEIHLCPACGMEHLGVITTH